MQNAILTGSDHVFLAEARGLATGLLGSQARSLVMLTLCVEHGNVREAAKPRLIMTATMNFAKHLVTIQSFIF